jgi:DNA-binding LacI/PurR family transcriptional regulator
MHGLFWRDSRKVLEWFASQSVPAFALYGRRQGVILANTGPLTRLALVGITVKLFNLEHHRIVMLSWEMRRVPEPSEFEQTFLNRLRDHRIEVGSYHFIAWEEGRDGFQSLLKSLFKVDPPSALIVHEP